AGIFGLSCAWACLQRGLTVRVVERATPGKGASGGPLGVLAAHAPERWNAEKACQRDALRALPGWIAQIEDAAGMSMQYDAVGRAQPLADAAARARAEALLPQAAAQWGDGAMWLEPGDARPDWVDPAAAPLGILVDRLTARLNPRAACSALAQAITAAGGRIDSGCDVREVSLEGLATARGILNADIVIIAAGAQSFELIRRALARAEPEDLARQADFVGTAVKGQAAWLDRALGARPVLYDRGVYVVAHAAGGVAVGSTSEQSWTDPETVDAAFDAVLNRARALCPALRDAPVAWHWAGLRPRARRGKPLLGPVPGHPGLFVATGGYKTGFGLSACIGTALADMIAGHIPQVPPSWLTADGREAAGAAC
ncbi:MAG: FAD-dependent oxidoreductase, partial [Pseudomonadota bacterium]